MNDNWFPCPSVELLVHPYGRLPMDAIGVLTILRAHQWEGPDGGIPVDPDEIYKVIKRPDDRGMTRARFLVIWEWIAPKFPIVGARRVNAELAHRQAGRKRATRGTQAGDTPDTRGQQAGDTRAASGGHAGSKPQASGATQPIENARSGEHATSPRERDRETDREREETEKDLPFGKPTGGTEAAPPPARPPSPPRPKKPRAAPAAQSMPFTIAEAMEVLKVGAVVEPFPREPKYPTQLTKLIRLYPSLKTWRMVGHWLAGGGDDWGGGFKGDKPTLDVVIAKFGAWVQRIEADGWQLQPVDDPDAVPICKLDVGPPRKGSLAWTMDQHIAEDIAKYGRPNVPTE